MTENGGSAWVQTIFYPFMYASVYGQGKTLRAITESDTYTTSGEGAAPFLAASVIYKHIELYCDDLKAVNSKVSEKVSPVKRTINGEPYIRLKKHSWNMLRFKKNK